MKRVFIRLNEIKNLKNVHPIQILQSILIFACFCALDTINSPDVIWIISASSAVFAIIILMFIAGKIRIGIWSNVLNVVAAFLCVGCFFLNVLFPIAIFLIALTAGIRIIYARQVLNDYSAMLFVFISVFFGIALRFVLILLPVWVLGIIMLATVFNPVCEVEQTNKADDNTTVKTKANKSIIYISVVSFVIFHLCVEVFGGPLTDAVSHNFPMQMVNVSYLLGYIVFTALVLIVSIKVSSLAVVVLSVLGLFFFLVPPTTNFGIYLLLFSGGGIKVLMLSLPIIFFKEKHKYIGVISGVLIYRAAFLLSGASKIFFESSWNISSTFTYSLAIINIVLGMQLIFLLAHWDKYDLKLQIKQIKSNEGNAEKVITIVEKVPITNGLPLPMEIFTFSEKKVAKLLALGKSRSEIAADLYLSENTVKTHTHNIFSKTEVNSQKAFIAKYIYNDFNFEDK